MRDVVYELFERYKKIEFEEGLDAGETALNKLVSECVTDLSCTREYDSAMEVLFSMEKEDILEIPSLTQWIWNFLEFYDGNDQENFTYVQANKQKIHDGQSRLLRELEGNHVMCVKGQDLRHQGKIFAAGPSYVKINGISTFNPLKESFELILYNPLYEIARATLSKEGRNDPSEAAGKSVGRQANYITIYRSPMLLFGD